MPYLEGATIGSHSGRARSGGQGFCFFVCSSHLVVCVVSCFGLDLVTGGTRGYKSSGEILRLAFVCPISAQMGASL